MSEVNRKKAMFLNFSGSDIYNKTEFEFLTRNNAKRKMLVMVRKKCGMLNREELPCFRSLYRFSANGKSKSNQEGKKETKDSGKQWCRTSLLF
jgi:hypothetical protein